MNPIHRMLALVLSACFLTSVSYASGTEQFVESFFLELPTDGIAVTHSGDVALGAGPPGVPLLSEDRIKDGLAMLAKIRNADGEVIGFASELESFPAGADMLHDDVVWDTDWTLMIPGKTILTPIPRSRLLYC